MHNALVLASRLTAHAATFMQFIHCSFTLSAILRYFSYGSNPQNWRKIAAKKEEANTGIFLWHPFIYNAIGSISAKLPEHFRYFCGLQLNMNGAIEWVWSDMTFSILLIWIGLLSIYKWRNFKEVKFAVLKEVVLRNLGLRLLAVGVLLCYLFQHLGLNWLNWLENAKKKNNQLCSTLFMSTGLLHENKRKIKLLCSYEEGCLFVHLACSRFLHYSFGSIRVSTIKLNWGGNINKKIKRNMLMSVYHQKLNMCAFLCCIWGLKIWVHQKQLQVYHSYQPKKHDSLFMKQNF